MDRDKIELPPLPPIAGMPSISAWIDELRIAAVLADRERRAEQAQPAKPTVHSWRVYLTKNGYAWTSTPAPAEHCTIVTLCWTGDGRAWIESEKNRELAAELLRLYSSGASIHCAAAADALDGGVR